MTSTEGSRPPVVTNLATEAMACGWARWGGQGAGASDKLPSWTRGGG